VILLPPLIVGFNSCDNYPNIGGWITGKTPLKSIDGSQQIFLLTPGCGGLKGIGVFQNFAKLSNSIYTAIGRLPNAV